MKTTLPTLAVEQYGENERNSLELYFSVAFFLNNLATILGTFFAPIIRSEVKCFKKDCYMLTFGIGTSFMIAILIIFIIGKKFYREDYKTDQKNLIANIWDCIVVALKNKFRKDNSDHKYHWLDYAEEKHPFQLINDLKTLLRVIAVSVTLITFWSVYGQQAPKWVSQAQKLNGRINGYFTIQPDQLLVLTPILNLLLVPLFVTVIYPACKRCNLFTCEFKRFGLGFLIAILALLLTTILEIRMKNSSISLNLPNQLRIVNLSPCNLNIIDSKTHNPILLEINRTSYLENKVYNIDAKIIDSIFAKSSQVKIDLYGECYQKNHKTKHINQTGLLITNQNLPKTLILYLENNDDNIELTYSYINKPEIKLFDYSYNSIDNKPTGLSQIKIDSFQIDNQKNNINGILIDKLRKHLSLYDLDSLSYNEMIDSSKYSNVDYSTYKFKLVSVDVEIGDIVNETIIDEETLLSTNILLESSGRYSILVFKNKNRLDYVLLTDIYPCGIHILWQMIQIFLFSVAEVIFSIDGILFTYTQAPKSMKSIIQAVWYLLLGIGNISLLTIVEFTYLFIKEQYLIYIFYALLLVLASVLYMFLIKIYHFDNPTCLPQFKMNELLSLRRRFSLDSPGNMDTQGTEYRRLSL